MADVCHTREECHQLYADLDPSKRRAAEEFLASKLQPEDKAKLRRLVDFWGPEDWLSHLYDDEVAKLSQEDRDRGYGALFMPHFGFGMGIRNLLRDGGFGEKPLGVHNLDCVYVDLLVGAIRL